MDSLLTFCVAIGVASALTGNRAAIALLCSLAASFTVTTGLGLWLLDVAVLCAIVRPAMPLADELIAALFVFAWAGYLCDDASRYEITFAVVTAQFLLTIPIALVLREVQIAREFTEDIAGFIRSRLSCAIARLSVG